MSDLQKQKIDGYWVNTSLFFDVVLTRKNLKLKGKKKKIK